MQIPDTSAGHAATLLQISDTSAGHAALLSQISDTSAGHAVPLSQISDTSAGHAALLSQISDSLLASVFPGLGGEDGGEVVGGEDAPVAFCEVGGHF